MLKKFKRQKSTVKEPMDLLLANDPFVKNEDERVKMTISCNDCKNLEKHRKAGLTIKIGGQDFQYMHNGLLVKKDAYYGSWMTTIISELKGHHEPQEEKVFHEVLKRLRSPGVMVELGSFWALYSMWYVSSNNKAKAFCVEPDPDNLQIGKTNVKANDLTKQVNFLNAACGDGHGEEILFQTENKGIKKLKLISTDWIVKNYGIKSIDILHLDIQGYELGALKASVESFRKGVVRFVFVSTHHYAFSGSPRTHDDCLSLLKSQGANIIAQHNVLESYSGDGLIVASFDKRDKDFKVEISRNTSSDSLFRSYESDLSILIEAYGGSNK